MFVFMGIMSITIIIGCFVVGCDTGYGADVTYTFDDSTIELELGQQYDLTNNKISEGEITKFECKTLTITDNKIVADTLGDHNICVTVKNGEREDKAYFKITIVDYSGRIEYYYNNAKVTSLSTIVGYDAFIEIYNTGSLEPTISVNNSNISYDKSSGKITPLSAGTSIIEVKVYCNGIMLNNRHLTITIVDPITTIDACIVDENKLSKSKFYKTNQADSISGYVELDNFAGSTDDILATGITLDNTISKVGNKTYIPFTCENIGVVNVKITHTQITDSKVLKCFVTKVINVYNYVEDIYVQSSIPLSADCKYHLYLPSQDIEAAKLGGYPNEITFSLSPSNTNTSVNLSLSCASNGVSIIATKVTAQKVGEYTLVINTDDGSGYFKNIKIVVEEILCTDISLNITNNEVYYIDYGTTLDIPLGLPTITPEYCTFKNYQVISSAGTIEGTTLKVSTNANIIITVSLGGIEKIYTISTIVKPSSITLAELGTSFSLFEFAINYGSALAYDTSVVTMYGYNNDWVTLGPDKAQVNGNTITFISSDCLLLTKLKLVYNNDNSIFAIVEKQ